MFPQDDTIAAISTPPGSGGIAVLRVSGPEAISTVDKLFSGKLPLREAEPRKMYQGRIIDVDAGNENNCKDIVNNALDEVLVVVFRSPNSYTTQDVVEISCHGGRFLSARILDVILRNGARLAEPGEFTLRAYLNGRLDLSQAEAVADLIRAKSDLSLQAALSHVQGIFSKSIRDLRQKLIDACSLFELELDFAEEDVMFADRVELNRRLDSVLEQIQTLADTYERGKILRDGAKLVIVGKPNVGKSSLLNALLKEERAIVTEIPGTTRDTLEEHLNIRGVPFRVVDTAGIRQANDLVEQEGVRRSIDQIRSADMILLLFDGSQELDEMDRNLMEQVLSVRDRSSDKENGLLTAINKIDLQRRTTKATVSQHVQSGTVLEVSAKEHWGLSELQTVLIQKAMGNTLPQAADPIVTNLRQKKSLEKAKQSLQHAQASLHSGLSSEFVALDLREAVEALGEIIGEVTTEDILGNIFSKFCIGK